MHLVNLLSSCCLLALLGALPARAAHEDPIEKAIEGFSRGLSNAEKEVGKALEGINNGITQAGREVERIFDGLSNMGSQAGKTVEHGLDKVAHGINSGVEHAGKEADRLAHGVNHAAGQGPHQGQSGYGGQHGGAAITTAVSGASVNKPFINFPALWRSIAAIMP
ncbi:similar to suprabasal-specific protein suprabasin (predicted), isoform CRA_b [Rattus norvegicus]|uniref:Suprabasin n=1 Tax=Rattus norvegicus TaxID=10116 RepID=Q32PY8_RAT|nr:suprabasin isoform 2 precursor [Rattus norvegicus]XP_038960437.1 suprabasin isoform X2 [Rattus norvegicus]AAI07925.1 Suprabasin [Rattus norvegicus]EDM07714.1 similar to suprabasal-specific protein suprabasin (predicted), isoform CRA_b [Rattus norvegicus]|eukprot:NP_001037696.1 suprabasin isoform 2 precursor [Rattus norvegicus]